MTIKSDLPIIEARDRTAWEQWLAANHQTSKGVWLKLAKKSAATPSVSRAEALEEAIRYGWIDGQGAPHDDSSWLQRFTPRGPRSKWSQINRDTASGLIAQGRMTPAGLAQVQAAQQDGRWDEAYPSQSSATIPEDFQAELDRHPQAKEFFDTLTGARRYSFLYRLHHVKRPDARAKRIANYIALLSDGRTLHD